MPADPAQTHVVKTFDHTSPLMACRFDPTGKWLFAGAEDQRIWRWELATGTKTELAAHDSWVRAIGFTPSGDVLATGGYDGRLILWPTTAEKPTPQRTIDAHQGWLRALSVSPDGQWLVTCGNDRLVKIWRLSDGTLIRTLEGHESHVWNVAVHPGGKDIISGDLKANFIHWDAESGQIKRKFTLATLYKYDTGFLADIGGPHSMAFSPDGKLLAAGGITNVTNAFAGVGNPAIVSWDWEAAKEKVVHLTKAKVQGVAWGTVLHAEGFTIGASGGGGGGHLFFWKPDQAEEFFTLNLGNTARDLALHPDGVQLATAHFDKKIRLLKMAAKSA
ncbi:MAG: WD40 repeat domain-containing protein [Planctomycetota bacterium]